MASIYRADTGEFLGYMVELYGPVDPSMTTWPFKAWRHSDGSLRSEPQGPVLRAGRLTAPPYLTCRIPLRNQQAADLQLWVPPEMLDFVLHHTGFRVAPKPAAA